MTVNQHPVGPRPALACGPRQKFSLPRRAAAAILSSATAAGRRQPFYGPPAARHKTCEVRAPIRTPGPAGLKVLDTGHRPTKTGCVPGRPARRRHSAPDTRGWRRPANPCRTAASAGRSTLVSAGFSLLRRWRAVALALPALAAALALPGCDDGYPEDYTYPLRDDPVVIKTPTFESYEPDRPGQLPLLSVSDLLDDRNP